MFLNEFRISALIADHSNGALTPEGKMELDLWIETDPRHRELMRSLMDEGTLAQELDDYFSVDRDEIYNKVQAGLNLDRNKPEVKKVNLWPRLILVAASVILIMAFGIFLEKQSSAQKAAVEFKKDISPGNLGATLTLANGKTIQLSQSGNGEIANEKDTRIIQSSNGQLVYEEKQSLGDNSGGVQINELRTSSGQTYHVTLPDGSNVWLNAASSLTYPASFKNAGTRTVNLSGEAYFEVAKDKKHPFLVRSNGQQIEVLGTHFNINTYANETVAATTLLEGSISMSAGQTKQILEPGEQALRTGTQVKVNRVSTESVVDWKQGDFYMDHINFKTAMRKLERWYNVEFVYDSSIADDLEAGGWISRSNNLSTVLKLIGKSGQVKFKIDDRKVYVFK